MCIIIVKPSGVEFPSIEELEVCEKKNKDGQGIAYYDGTRVVVKKDFPSSKEVLEYCNNSVGVHRDVIIHYRWRTAGASDIGGRHPFPINISDDVLRNPEIKCDVAMAHNGTISGVGTDKILSDSQLFVKKYMAIPGITWSTQNKELMDLLEKLLGHGRIALIDKDGIGMIGTFTQDNGRFYSNDGYKEYKYVAPTYGASASGWTGKWNGNLYAGHSQWDADEEKDTKEENVSGYKWNKVTQKMERVGDIPPKPKSKLGNFNIWAKCAICKVECYCDEFENVSRMSCVYMCEWCLDRATQYKSTKFKAMYSEVRKPVDDTCCICNTTYADKKNIILIKEKYVCLDCIKKNFNKGGKKQCRA